MHPQDSTLHGVVFQKPGALLLPLPLAGEARSPGERSDPGGNPAFHAGYISERCPGLDCAGRLGCCLDLAVREVKDRARQKTTQAAPWEGLHMDQKSRNREPGKSAPKGS